MAFADHILEVLLTSIALACPASIMGISAWLIYKRVPGAGWFLIAATMVAGSYSFHFDGFH